MKYKTILWDIDGTLLNFEMSEKISMEKCLEKPHPERHGKRVSPVHAGHRSVIPAVAHQRRQNPL